MGENLRKEVEELTMQIVGEVDHGECFYEETEYEDFVRTLDLLKDKSRELYNKNQNVV